jgi:hypothetical protein
MPVAGRFRLSAAGRWVWLGSFALLAGLLLIRSSFLFTTPLYETADEADNSILVMQAQHFTLLHGNYSREGFWHPGPAYMYVMAAGQWLFHDATHLVPTPWNGQLIVIMLLNSALVATVVWIVHSWSGSVWSAVAALATMIGLATAVDVGVPVVKYHSILASNWPPDFYVPTFLAFIVAAASVAAGRTSHLWLLAATGWLLIHGHAVFLFFVPLITAATAAAALWPARRAPWAAVRRFLRCRRSHYVPAMLISAVFVLPIAADLILRWPGQFGRYVRYSDSAKAGHHTVGQAIRYILWYWAPGPLWLPILVAGAAVTAAVVVVSVVHSPTRARPASPPLHRFLLTAILICAATTAGMLYYAMRGIDYLHAAYIGFFYWSVPLLMFVVVATGLTAAGQGRVITKVIVGAALVMALAAGAISPGLRADVHDNEPSLFATMTALAARAHGHLIVLRVRGGTGFDAGGLVLQAERLGVHACLAGPYPSVFRVTSQFLCRPAQISTGVTYRLYRLSYKPVAGVRVIARLRYSVLTVDPASLSK